MLKPHINRLNDAQIEKIFHFFNELQLTCQYRKGMSFQAPITGLGAPSGVDTRRATLGAAEEELLPATRFNPRYSTDAFESMAVSYE